MTPLQQVTAIVLAGGSRDDALAASAGVESKAFYPLAGRPLIAYVLDALAASATVAATVAVAPEGAVLPAAVDARVPAGRGYAQSLALGLGGALALAPERRILVVTADLPWLSAAAVDRFVTQAGVADLAYPVVTRETSLAQFPRQRRTFVRTRQGHLTGGNLVSLTPSLVPRLLELMDRAYRARKNPLALASLVGPLTLVQLLSGRADVGRLERIVGEMLGGSARAIISEDACLAADIDRPPPAGSAAP